MNPLDERREFLTAEREHALAVRMVAGDKTARDKMIVAHVPLASRQARRAARKTGLPFEDLRSEAMIALVTAAPTFDPEAGYRFATYALRPINWHINDYIVRNWSIVRGSMGNDAKMIALRSAFGGIRYPDRELDRTSISGEPRSHALPDYSETPEQAAVRNSAEFTAFRIVEKALHGLKPREEDIVRKRVMAHPDDVESLEVLGQRYGLSRERIRQIEVQTLDKISLRIPQSARHIVSEAA